MSPTSVTSSVEAATAIERDATLRSRGLSDGFVLLRRDLPVRTQPRRELQLCRGDGRGFAKSRPVSACVENPALRLDEDDERRPALGVGRLRERQRALRLGEQLGCEDSESGPGSAQTVDCRAHVLCDLDARGFVGPLQAIALEPGLRHARLVLVEDRQRQTESGSPDRRSLACGALRTEASRHVAPRGAAFEIEACLRGLDRFLHGAQIEPARKGRADHRFRVRDGRGNVREDIEQPDRADVRLDRELAGEITPSVSSFEPRALQRDKLLGLNENNLLLLRFETIL